MEEHTSLARRISIQKHMNCNQSQKELPQKNSDIQNIIKVNAYVVDYFVVP